MNPLGEPLPDELGEDSVANCLGFDGLADFLGFVSDIEAVAMMSAVRFVVF